MPLRKRVISILRERGHKITPQRKVVLEVISRSCSHLTPAAVYERARRQQPGIGLVTVYRTLELLAQLGFICEVHSGDDNRRYLLRRSLGHHHHLICSGCNSVVDFTDCDLAEMERKIAERTGFRIESHLVEFTGTCRQCLEEGMAKC